MIKNKYIKTGEQLFNELGKDSDNRKMLKTKYIKLRDLLKVLKYYYGYSSGKYLYDKIKNVK